MAAALTRVIVDVSPAAGVAMRLSTHGNTVTVAHIETAVGTDHTHSTRESVGAPLNAQPPH